MTEDTFRDAVLSAAHSALIDDDASEGERQQLADDLIAAWPPEMSALPIQAQISQMEPALRKAFHSLGIPDDQVFVTAYALAHAVQLGEPFEPS
jgi:hypothetical protein